MYKLKEHVTSEMLKSVGRRGMKLNLNHQTDGEQAWKESGLTYGQQVTYKGKSYNVIAIGYGVLLHGKVQIDNGEELMTVSITDLEKIEVEEWNQS